MQWVRAWFCKRLRIGVCVRGFSGTLGNDKDRDGEGEGEGEGEVHRLML